VFIKKIGKNMRNKFVFVLRKPDGSEYEKAVFADSEVEAKLRLKNVLDIFNSQDEVVQLNQPSSEQ
jgi:hypothetical protein